MEPCSALGGGSRLARREGLGSRRRIWLAMADSSIWREPDARFFFFGPVSGTANCFFFFGLVSGTANCLVLVNRWFRRVGANVFLLIWVMLHFFFNVTV